MLHLFSNRNISRSWLLSLLPLAALIVLFPVACDTKPQSAPAQTSARTYASPEEAGKALQQAAQSQNQDSMLAIFGPGSKDLIYSGDATEDQTSLEGFARAYDAMHRWRNMPDGSEVLLVGTDNQAFPIPLKKNPATQWYFDTAAGEEEILSRRIGRDENAAIDVCAALASAQAEYFAQRHDGVEQYAQKFVSDPGKQDGLYWGSADGQPRSPVGPLVASATDEGYSIKSGPHQAFHGYFFRILDKQGQDAKGGAKSYIVNGKMTSGFAYVAYPDHYGDSGIASFIINQDGTVYQQDLGKDTAGLVKTMAEFNPDKGWTAVY